MLMESLPESHVTTSPLTYIHCNFHNESKILLLTYKAPLCLSELLVLNVLQHLEFTAGNRAFSYKASNQIWIVHNNRVLCELEYLYAVTPDTLMR